MLKVILLSVKVLREQGATWVYLLAGEQDVMSSTSDPSSSSMDTFRQRLRQTESSEESIEPLSLCDDIYCDISEEISCQQDSPWTDFWRKLGRGDRRKKSKLKKGERMKKCFIKRLSYFVNIIRRHLREAQVHPFSRREDRHFQDQRRLS